MRWLLLSLLLCMGCVAPPHKISRPVRPQFKKVQLSEFRYFHKGETHRVYILEDENCENFEYNVSCLLGYINALESNAAYDGYQPPPLREFP